MGYHGRRKKWGNSLRFLILSDVHANATALRAVLQHTAGWRIDGIYSLGDQLNCGPMPRQTLNMLKDAGAALLMGNHEERLVKMRTGDRELNENYNWSMLQWTSSQIVDESLPYQKEIVVGEVLFTHAVPGDLNRLVRPCDTEEADAILQKLNQTRLVCGHYHTPWRHKKTGKELVCIGSLGMLEDNIGRNAGFALLENEQVELYSIPYDPSGLKTAYVESGLAKAAPEFARAAYQTMLTGEQELVIKFVNAMQAVAASQNIPWQSREAVMLAAERFPWTEDVSCEAFWARA